MSNCTWRNKANTLGLKTQTGLKSLNVYGADQRVTFLFSCHNVSFILSLPDA
jgi:hypothetical protein